MNERKVWIRSHYERFPATIKGAFVMRGVDRDPHQVRLREANVVEVASGEASSIDIQPAVLDVAPHLDLFVPFEFPILELEPGWYRLSCDVEIDGTPGVERPGAPFPIAWPRGSTRRGSFPVGKAVAPKGGPKVSIDGVECLGDHAKLHFSAEEAADLRMRTDLGSLAVIEETFDPDTGKGLLTTYPVLRAHDSLTVEVRARSKPRSEPALVNVRLS